MDELSIAIYSLEEKNISKRRRSSIVPLGEIAHISVKSGAGSLGASSRRSEWSLLAASECRNWQVIDQRAPGGDSTRKRASFPVGRHYANGKAVAAGKLKALLIAAIYLGLRRKREQTGASAMTADGLLVPGAFTWDDLRHMRQLLPDLDTLPIHPDVEAGTVPTIKPDDFAATDAPSSGSSSQGSSSSAQPPDECRSLVQDVECFLQNTPTTRMRQATAFRGAGAAGSPTDQSRRRRAPDLTWPKL